MVCDKITERSNKGTHMFRGRKDTLFIVILAGIVGLVLVVFLTPVYSWLTGDNKESPPPAATQPSQLPQPSPPATKETSLTQEELQQMFDGFIAKANASGKAKIEYLRVKMEQDRMLVSARGEAMGYQGETENMEVRFKGRTLFASGVVKAFGLAPQLVAEVDITTVGGKPKVEVKNFQLGGLPLTMLNLGPERITAIINGAIESRGWKLPFDIESLRIEGSKLIIVPK